MATTRIDSGETFASNKNATVGVQMTVRIRTATYRYRLDPAT